MKTAKKVVLRSSAVLAVAMAAAGVSAPVFADLSATVAGSNMYLWRGQAISKSSPQISGSLDLKHSSGAFAGIWGSSEGVSGSSETDVYGGYAGKAGDFSYGLTLWQYYYAETDGTLAHGEGEQPGDVQLTAGFGPVAFNAFFDANNSSNVYYTLGYSYDKFSVMAGTWSRDDADDVQGEYSHLDVYYQATPELKFGLSKVVDAAEADSTKGESIGGAVYGDNVYTTAPNITKQESDPLFYVSYAKTFEL